MYKMLLVFPRVKKETMVCQESQEKQEDRGSLELRFCSCLGFCWTLTSFVSLLQGDPGVPGEPGDQGETGDKGESGDGGDMGEKGINGTMGEMGQKGEMVCGNPYNECTCNVVCVFVCCRVTLVSQATMGQMVQRVSRERKASMAELGHQEPQSVKKNTLNHFYTYI